MDSDQEIISTHNLNKKFGGIVVAKNVNFSVNKGELRCLIGPNGAGKSTLFSLLCGIEKADSGQITTSTDFSISGLVSMISFKHMLQTDLPSK